LKLFKFLSISLLSMALTFSSMRLLPIGDMGACRKVRGCSLRDYVQVQFMDVYEAAVSGVHRSTSRYIRGLEIGRDLAAGGTLECICSFDTFRISVLWECLGRDSVAV